MPRTKKTKTKDETDRSLKGSGRRKSAKASNSVSVAEMLQSINSRASSSGDNAASSSRSPSASRSSSVGTGKREDRRPAGRSQKKGNQASDKSDARQGDQSQRVGKRTGKQSGTASKRKQVTNESQVSPKGATPNSPSKRKRHTGQRETLDESSYLERQVSAQSLAKWQSLSKTSQEYLQQLMDSSISDVLTEASSSNYDDIQDNLNNLKRRLTSAFVTLKVPTKRQPNYRDMESHMQALEAALVETSNQVECLDKEVKLQQKLLRDKEEELEKLEAAAQEVSPDSQQEMAKRLHPILQEDREDVLGLLPLRKNRDLPSDHQFDDIRSSCQQPVLETLRSLSQKQTGQEAPEITDFIDAVTAIQASLPK